MGKSITPASIIDAQSNPALLAGFIVASPTHYTYG